jgi:DNA mismatch repair ATPase MutS
MAYTLPVFHEPDSHKAVQTMQIQGVYHPLVKHPVTNDVTTKRCMLLTGSNASGKSTFLKAAAINALFAQTIHTVLADTYEACFFRIYSSMALRDDILSKESYFIVEIKSLKRIFSALQTASEIPVLCFVDEILRGTNTVERVAASSVLLDALSKEKAMCFAATHDVELTYLLEEQFENYHFEEQLSEGDISFDYRLRKGRADSRNAIRLLSMIGFEKELVSKAQGRVEAFLGKGIWE